MKITEEKYDNKKPEIPATENLPVFERSPIATLCVGEAGTILEANQASVTLFQIKRELLLDKPLVTFVDQKYRRPFNTHLFNLSSGKECKAEIELKLRFGDVVHALLHSKPVFENGKFLFSIVSIIDISQQKIIEHSLTRTQEELKFLAHHDPLTNLPNRYLFQDRLESAMIRTKRNGWLGAVVFADVDRFKVINDDYGHYVGDEVLKEVSKRLTSTVREQDTVCRYSGDEFILILEDITCEIDAKNVIGKIINAFTEPVTGLIEHPLKVSTSLGVCLFDKQDNDSEAIIKRADYAMYESKKRGRNCYTFFSSEHSITQNLNIIMENDLNIAFENNEFHLNFQPQYNISNGLIEGVEVLIRWQHPRRGLVNPDQFIYRMVNANLINNLTDWVINEACKVGNSWLDQNINFKRLAINVTPKEFASSNLINIVRSALDVSGFPPHKLELELTESSIMQNPSVAARVLRELREMGIRLSLDDFGTGYSSLSYLNDYPFHCIKIDKSFVNNLPTNRKSAALVDAIIRIARALDLDIVAEGVEIPKQKEYLTSRGCELMQGFLFSPPVEYCEMTELFNGQKISSVS